jgi:hypothetical protein
VEFKLRKTKRSRRRYKEWRAKPYRITWTCEVKGVRVPGHYFSCVQVTLPDGRVMWDFVGRRGTHKTFHKAAEAAEKHAKLWQRATDATGIRMIEDIFGRVPFGIPVGAKLTRKVHELLATHYD